MAAFLHGYYSVTRTGLLEFLSARAEAAGTRLYFWMLTVTYGVTNDDRDVRNRDDADTS